MQIWLVPGFQKSTGQSSFQNFQPLVSGNKFFSWEKNWYRLGKAAAHVLEEVCKRIGDCDRDAERWNDFHYVTEGSENLREEAVSCFQKFHENSHRAETEGCSGKKNVRWIAHFCQMWHEPFNQETCGTSRNITGLYLQFTNLESKGY